MGNTSTIRDVARYAGVSTATVSRVMNGIGVVRPDTKKKVEDAIKHLNYLPNEAARNLKTESSKLVGFIVSSISNGHFSSMAKMAEKFFERYGYNLIVCSTEDDGVSEVKYLQRMMQMQVEGLIVNTTGKNDELISEISSDVPIVLVDRYVSHPGFVGDFVGSNNYAGIEKLTQFLIAHGHRRIGIINSNLKVSTGVERFSAFRESMGRIRVTVGDDYEYRYDSQSSSIEDGYDGCRYLMNLAVPPTAIVIANNTLAIGAYKYINDHGIDIPGMLSIVSYGNIDNSDLFRISPTYTTLNSGFFGEKAANFLLSRIGNPGIGNREVIFEPSLFLGNSAGVLDDKSFISR